MSYFGVPDGGLLWGRDFPLVSGNTSGTTYTMDYPNTAKISEPYSGRIMNVKMTGTNYELRVMTGPNFNFDSSKKDFKPPEEKSKRYFLTAINGEYWYVKESKRNRKKHKALTGVGQGGEFYPTAGTGTYINYPKYNINSIAEEDYIKATWQIGNGVITTDNTGPLQINYTSV